MKIKYRFSDFCVEEELHSGILSDEGIFHVWRIEKRGIDTLDLINQISKIFNIRRERITTCGLKDKYSVSLLHLAVDTLELNSNLPKKISGRGFSGYFVGKSKEPLKPKFIKGNRFKIVLRDIHLDEVKDYENNIKDVARYGLPNYFDEQRFGSVRHLRHLQSKTRDGIYDFIARRIILGDYESALKIHFMALSPEDRSKVRKFKKKMRKLWGKWRECLLYAQNKNDIQILKHLKKNKDFLTAISLIDRRLLRLYLETYQSYVWNSVLSNIIKDTFSKVYYFPYYVGNFVFPLEYTDDAVRRVRDIKIPLPHRDVEIPDFLRKYFSEVTLKEGISLKEFLIPKEMKVDFTKMERKAWINFPEVSWKVEDDEYFEQRKKITIEFGMPPGSFATILVKKITPLIPKSITEKKPFL